MEGTRAQSFILLYFIFPLFPQQYVNFFMQFRSCNSLKNHFFQSKQYVYIYFTKSYNFKNFRKEVPNVVLSNEAHGTYNINIIHWHAKNTWFLVQKSQIVSKYHDNVVSIVLYWTFLGLSAPYEVVERSCAFFCILIYFTRYKMYMCVGIGWSLNQLPFSNQLPSCDFRWAESFK